MSIPDPVTALLIGAALLCVLAGVLWPKYGLLAGWERLRMNTRRVHIEDALKHLYDCEYRRISCTGQSIAGTLSITNEASTRLLERLATMRLVHPQGDGFALTGEGRSYALRVIRMHRLWERYLADETGVEEMRWHAEAEAAEHRMTQTEADTLASRMGNPPFDPHGDPIPTASGDLPARRGVPLSQIPAGELTEIVHVEDEPPAVYAQIVALGLVPGQRLRVLETSAERIRFEADGNEAVLAPVVAGNVTVLPLSVEETAEPPSETLATLEPGQVAVVAGIVRRCRGLQRRRLMDLGIVPGTVIHAELQGAAGGPAAYRVRGALIALRRSHAALIQITRLEKTSA